MTDSKILNTITLLLHCVLDPRYKTGVLSDFEAAKKSKNKLNRNGDKKLIRKS